MSQENKQMLPEQAANQLTEEQETLNKLKDLDVLSNFMFNAIATDPTAKEPFFREVLSIRKCQTPEGFQRTQTR